LRNNNPNHSERPEQKATFTETAKRAQEIALIGLDRHRRFYGWSAGHGLVIRTFNTLYGFAGK
jgi:hypothetical protein